MGHEGIVDDPQFAADGNFAAWTSVFVDDRNVDTSDFELRGRHWSWLHRRVVRHYVSVSIFVLGSHHFDERFPFGGQGFRGNSVDQRCEQSELFHGSYMFGTFGLCSGVAENACTWVGYVAESLDHGWSQSSGSGNRGLGRGFRSGTCLPHCHAPDLPQVSLCKGEGPFFRRGGATVTGHSMCECWSIPHN